MIIDGKELANNILKSLTPRLTALPNKPVFIDVVVGDDSVVWSYVKMKGQTAQQIGIAFETSGFPETITTDELCEAIEKINANINVCGLIVQLPLPPNIDRQKVLDAIDPAIDVDCLGRRNSDLFYGGHAYIQPPTAAAIMHILDSLPVSLADKNILVVGQGALVGKPVTFLLEKRRYKVRVADRKTENLSELTAEADVIISGAGSPKLITGDLIKAGAVVIDAGTAEWNNTIVGDVDLDTVAHKAAYVSPVPGGVGPVTVARLLENVVIVAERRRG